MKLNKTLLAYLVIGIAIFTIPMLLQTGAIDINSTVKISSTDNSVVQAMLKESRVFSGDYFKYYSLPCEMGQYGASFKDEIWFQERYKIDGVYETFEHGPFYVTFSSWDVDKLITIELNQENVTITFVG